MLSAYVAKTQSSNPNRHRDAHTLTYTANLRIWFSFRVAIFGNVFSGPFLADPRSRLFWTLQTNLVQVKKCNHRFSIKILSILSSRTAVATAVPCINQTNANTLGVLHMRLWVTVCRCSICFRFFWVNDIILLDETCFEVKVLNFNELSVNQNDSNINVILIYIHFVNWIKLNWVQFMIYSQWKCPQNYRPICAIVHNNTFDWPPTKTEKNK